MLVKYPQMLNKLSVLLITAVFAISAHAQELDCKIQVSSQQVQGTNKEVYRTMQSELFEFINNTKWTNHAWGPEERIDCNIMINITDEVSSDEFRGKITIQARRPVHNSSYFTNLINYVDNDFQIRYVEFEKLEYNESGSNSNLVSIISYWVFIILGLDYDSFSYEGGTEYFQKAESIVNRNQNAVEKGWKSFESLKNRYWLVENMLNNRYSGMRQFIYNYHRLGLDMMAQKPTEGRMQIAESLSLLQQVHRDKPNSFIMQLVTEAKGDEMVNIFSESFPEEKSRVIQILSEIDAANSAKYTRMNETQNSGSPGTPGTMMNNPKTPVGRN
jgi:hypothetical protein